MGGVASAASQKLSAEPSTTTLVAAVALGVLSGGVFIPVGAGYALSPYPRRFVLGLFVSTYLMLAVIGSMGLGWPMAVLYATLLNSIALRDLARLALKARIDGFVDKRAFLPPVCDRVWVSASGVRSPDDAWKESDGVPFTDGSLRDIVRWLKDQGERASAAVTGAPGRLTSKV